VKQELRLLLEAGVPDLLFRPFKHWVLCYIEVNNLSTREFHDDEYVENTKRNRRLHKEVHDHMASAWFFKKLRQAWESSGPGRLLTMYFLTVEQAWLMPNFTSNFKAMRSSPYSG
jgi:hypothetical protein